MAADPLLERRLFTVDDYERMVEAGILDADSRVELLEDEIATTAAIGSRHASIVNRVTRLLIRRLGDDVLVTPGTRCGYRPGRSRSPISCS